ncbi:DUF4145 domain-containing protein [Tenacibaculum dicentrarchi]|nr:DUF4145 domain-containing protein [Tenacibaculum dicentrarchi]
MNFDFISDKNFRELLIRDYQELKNCIESKSIKSVLVLSGSIIEAVLTEYFIQFPPNGKTEPQILSSTLNNLIEWAVQEGVISEKEKNLAGVVKDYRNLIHPGREIRKGEKFDFDSAKISESVLNIIVDSVKTVYLEKYGYSADEVFEKLKKDWHFQSIFDKVILKLNQNERSKLLGYLIDFDKWEKSKWECFMQEGPMEEYEVYDLEDVKPFILKLKPLVSSDLIKSNLAKMIKEIETGESINAYSLFHLFHENMDLMSEDEQEIVVIYMLNIYTTVLDENKNVIADKTFSTIGKYIKTDKSKNALKDFIDFCAVHFSHKRIKSEMDLLEQVFNSLSADVKTQAETHLTSFLSPIENLPPNIKIFYDEALERNMVNNNGG